MFVKPLPHFSMVAHIREKISLLSEAKENVVLFFKEKNNPLV